MLAESVVTRLARIEQELILPRACATDLVRS